MLLSMLAQWKVKFYCKVSATDLCDAAILQHAGKTRECDNRQFQYSATLSVCCQCSAWPNWGRKGSNLLLDFEISIYGVNKIRILNKIINLSFTVGKEEMCLQSAVVWGLQLFFIAINYSQMKPIKKINCKQGQKQILPEDTSTPEKRKALNSEGGCISLFSLCRFSAIH